MLGGCVVCVYWLFCCFAVRYIKSIDGFYGCYRGLAPKLCAHTICAVAFDKSVKAVKFEDEPIDTIPIDDLDDMERLIILENMKRSFLNYFLFIDLILQRQKVCSGIFQKFDWKNGGSNFESSLWSYICKNDGTVCRWRNQVHVSIKEYIMLSVCYVKYHMHYV